MVPNPSDLASVTGRGGAPLVRQLNVAWRLTLAGDSQAARNVCGAIVDRHAGALVQDGAAKHALLRCLLLLRMPQLLARLLRLTDGVALEAGPRRRDQLEFTLPSGTRVALRVPAEDVAPAHRAEAAAEECAALMEAVAAETPPAAPSRLWQPHGTASAGPVW